MKNKEAIRNHIIDVAEKIFSKLGFDRTTMEIIAKEARKGKSTLYYYFKSKEEIFAGVIDREGNLIQKELLKVINQNKDSKTLLKEYVLKRFQLLKKLVNYYNVFKEDYLRELKIIEKYRKKHDEFEFLAIKQILIKGIMNDEISIKQDAIDDIAFAIAVALKGLEIPLFFENKYSEFEHKIDLLLDVLYCGLIKDRSKC